MGSNGAHYAGKSDIYFPTADNPLVTLRASTTPGGGDIYAGPFVNWSVNLGPVAGRYTDTPVNPLASGLGYNPRHIRRDISAYVAQLALNDSQVANLITSNTDIANFQYDLEGRFLYGQPGLGVHTAGHYLIGGDPGGDLYTSPG
jgi:tyrosinase